MPDPIVRTVETTTHGRFLLHVPRAVPPARRALVGFHGYGENAERHLAELERIPGVESWLLAAVQGLHRFYRFKSPEVVASWMTTEDRELMIADNVAYVDRIVGALRREHEIERLVFVGFSQGVAMAFRAAMLGAAPADGVIALGGDVPPEFRASRQREFPRILIGRGTGDTWYTGEKMSADLALLESAGARVEPLVFDGGHEWTDAFREAVGRFLV